MHTLDLETLNRALAGEYTAIRPSTQMKALGEKVFPPTYEGGEYATEQRQLLQVRNEL